MTLQKTVTSGSFPRLMLLSISVIWGFSYVVIDVAMLRMSPMLFNALRFSVALAVMGLAYAILRRSRFAAPGAYRTAWREGVVLGMILFAAFATQTYGFQTTTATNAGFLTGLGVVFVPLINRVLFNRSVDPVRMAAIALSVLGTAFLTGVAEGGMSGLVIGDALIVLSAAFFALHIVYTDRFVAQGNAMELVLWQIKVMTVLFVLGAIVVEGEDPIAAVSGIDHAMAAAILFTAILSTCYGYAAQTWLQKFVAPVQVALILGLEPVLASGFDYMVSGVQLSPAGAFGGAVILLAVALSEFGPALLRTPAGARE